MTLLIFLTVLAIACSIPSFPQRQPIVKHANVVFTGSSSSSSSDEEIDTIDIDQSSRMRSPNVSSIPLSFPRSVSYLHSQSAMDKRQYDQARDQDIDHQWHCNMSITWKDLGVLHYPRFLREVTCAMESCMYGFYTCRSQSFMVRVLTVRDGDENVDVTVPITLRQGWRFVEDRLVVANDRFQAQYIIPSLVEDLTAAREEVIYAAFHDDFSGDRESFRREVGRWKTRWVSRVPCVQRPYRTRPEVASDAASVHTERDFIWPYNEYGGNVSHASRLSVSGTHFVKNGQRVFLSGTNQAWVHYAKDFGRHQYQGVQSAFEGVLSQIQASGGNSIRVWLHIEGETSPHFTSDGHVDKTDSSGSLISDMRSYLHAAQRHNILVFFTLWNGAKKQSTHYRLHGLIVDTGKLQSYIDHALVPMVRALKTEPALGGWDIMNEPEGELKPGLSNTDPCFDTRSLSGSGAGWEGQLYTAQQLQRFINWQADAIRREDPGAMVTIGSWNPKSNTDGFGFHNLWKDSCLKKAGGKQYGVLTFYQYHTYDNNGHWDGYSPFQHHFNDFHLDKPLVIGEFRQSDGAGTTIEQLYNYAYYYGYAGAWSWQAVDNNWTNARKGLVWLKGRNDQNKGGLVNFSL